MGVQGSRWWALVKVAFGQLGEPTVPVAAPELSALGLARFPPGPALVHGVADVVVDGQ